MSDKYVSHSGLTYFWSKLKTLLADKQDTLISGTNIKTINGVSVLGSGDIKGLVCNSSTASQSGFSSDTYLAGSRIVFPYAPNVGTRYKLMFDVTKTASGTATPIIYIRVGTLGTTSDSAVATLTFGAGTAAVDTGVFEVICSFRTVGTSAVMQCISRLTSNLTTTGLSNAKKSILATSSKFNSTTANLGIGVSYNGGYSASHTVQLTSAELVM